MQPKTFFCLSLATVFVLSCLIKKCSFNLLCVLDCFSLQEKNLKERQRDAVLNLGTNALYHYRVLLIRTNHIYTYQPQHLRECHQGGMAKWLTITGSRSLNSTFDCDPLLSLRGGGGGWTQCLVLSLRVVCRISL